MKKSIKKVTSAALSFILAVCAVCSMSLPFVSAETKKSVSVTLSADKATAEAGDSVTYTVNFSTTDMAKCAGIEFVFDANVFEVEDYDWLFKKAKIANYDEERKFASLTYDTEKLLSGDAFTLTLKVKDGAKAGSYTVKAVPTMMLGTEYFEVNNPEATLTVGGDVPQPSGKKVTATLTGDKDTAKAGDSITYTVNFSTTDMAKCAGIEFVFDANVFEVEDYDWLFKKAKIANYDEERKFASLTYDTEKLLSGDAFTLTLKVKDGAKAGSYTVKAVPTMMLGTEYFEVNNPEAVLTVSEDTPVSGSKKLITTISADKTTVSEGETVTYTVNFNTDDAAKCAGIEFVFDSRVFEVEDYDWLLKKAQIANYDEDKNFASIVYDAETLLVGDVFTLTLKVKAGAETGSYTVKAVPTMMLGTEFFEAADVQVKMTVNGQTPSVIRGDFDNNKVVDRQDAIYLLFSSIFGEDDYPRNQNGDVNGDSEIDRNDAIHLLYYSVFPENYPLA